MRRKKPRGKPVERDEGSPLAAAVAGQDADTIRMVTDAIRHKQVMLAFQPVMTADAPHRVVFYEGLIRVLDGTGRIIPARDFMAQVAESELGRQLDCLALELGLAALARKPDLRLSVNMSARSIGYARWNAILQRMLKRRADIAERLILEISESSLVQLPDLISDFMDTLLIRGVSFVLDDFGAGLTSFTHFRDFDFQFVKLDGSFSRGIEGAQDTQALTAGIAAICQRLDIVPIASHVERPQEAETLRAMGVPCLQGFLFGAPSVTPPWEAGETGRRARA